MNDDLRLLALFALYDLAREDRPAHVGNVAARLGAERIALVRALKALERKGLCDAARCRLTMSGLLVARALRAERTQHAQRNARAA